jgi:hypothetical protein
VGWFNSECPSFVKRAEGRFELVLCLAVMHHIAKDGVPLREIVRMAHYLTSRYAIIEVIDRRDDLFRTLIHGREALFEGFNAEQFEKESAGCFTVVSRESLSPTRSIYFLERKPVTR